MPEITESTPSDLWKLFSEASFKIGADDQVAELRSRYPTEPDGEEEQKNLEDAWGKFMTKVQVQTGTLLKTDSVSFLLGAGASKECGGVLIGSIPLPVERKLLAEGISGETNPRMRKWLVALYRAAARTKGRTGTVPTTRDAIIERREAIVERTAAALPVNYEALLSLLWRWRSSLPETGGQLRLDGDPLVNVKAAELDDCLDNTTRVLAERCRLPTKRRRDRLASYQEFMRKVLTRPLNLKRANIFTLNYDTLVEQAADAEGVVLIDGFIGATRRVFRPECYDQDLYFPAQTTEGRVHRLDRVAHLYKLHGSITWFGEEPDWDNPYGVTAASEDRAADGRRLIYPTPAKFGESLGIPYAELFRRFATCVVRPQSTLFVLGYGFGDDHVNAIIRQAVAVPSFTLVIVDPNPVSDFVRRLRLRQDRRVWILSGTTFGTFGGFVQRVLPDLRDEDVRRKVMATYRALGATGDDPAPPIREEEDA